MLMRSFASRAVPKRTQNLSFKTNNYKFSSQPRNFVTKYTKEHEWVDFSADNKSATIGITDHAQSQLGEVVYLETKDVGTQLKIGVSFGQVESVKASSDIYSPVDAVLSEVNPELAATVSLINSDAEKAGWIIKVDNITSINKELLSAEEYAKLIDH